MPHKLPRMHRTPEDRAGAAWIAVWVGIALFAASPLHAGPIGPSQHDAERYQLSVGVGGFRQTSRVKPESKANFGTIDLRQNLVYLQLQNPAFCFSRDGAGFLRAGGADIDDGAEFHGGYKFFGGFGIRDTWFGGEETVLSLGTVAQANFFSGQDGVKTFLDGYPSKVRLRSIWDASIAVPVQWRPSKGVLVYAGPVAAYRALRVRRTVAGADETIWYREKSPLGGFGGGRISFFERWSLELEGQYMGAVSVGATLSRAF